MVDHGSCQSHTRIILMLNFMMAIFYLRSTVNSEFVINTVFIFPMVYFLRFRFLARQLRF